MYKIIDFKSPVAAVIFHQPTGTQKTVHVNHLRPLFGNAAWDRIYTDHSRVAPKRLKNQKLRALMREGGRPSKEPTKIQPARTQKMIVPPASAPTPPEVRTPPPNATPRNDVPAPKPNINSRAVAATPQAKRQRTLDPQEENPYAKPRTPKRKRNPSEEDRPRIGAAAGTRSQAPATPTPAMTPLPQDADSSSESQMSCDVDIQDTPGATATIPMTVDSTATPKRPLSDTDSESNGQPPAKAPHKDEDTASEDSAGTSPRMDESSDEDTNPQ